MRAAALSLFRVSLKVFKWLLFAALALVLLTLASWWLVPDEALDPAASRLMAPHSGPPTPDNGQFAIWGLRASPGMDPYKAGMAFAAEHERLLAAKGDLASFDPDSVLGPAPLPKPEFKPCNRDEHSCLAYYHGIEKEIGAKGANSALLLQRYRSLRGYSRFAQTDVTLTFESTMPDTGVTVLSALTDAEIALRVRSPGGREAALRELAAEVRLWRDVLMGSDTLIPKLVAAAMLKRKYALASEIMLAYPDVGSSSLLADITRPLPPERMRLGASLDAEFRQFALSMSNPDGGTYSLTGNAIGDALLKGALRPNATVNELYRRLVAWRDLYAASPERLLAHGDHTGMNRDLKELWHPATLFYNPMGKVLLAVQSDYDKYALRMVDLVGESRLVELQRRALVARLAPQGRPKFIASSPPGLADPYTGRPFALNDSSNSLCFKTYGQRGGAGSKLCVYFDKQESPL